MGSAFWSRQIARRIGHVADILSERFEIGRGVESDAAGIDAPVWDYVGIHFEICHDLLDGVLEEVNEFRKIFDFSVGGVRSTAQPPQRGKPSGPPVATGRNVTRQERQWRAAAPDDELMLDFARFTEASKRPAFVHFASFMLHPRLSELRSSWLAVCIR